MIAIVICDKIPKCHKTYCCFKKTILGINWASWHRFAVIAKFRSLQMVDCTRYLHARVCRQLWSRAADIINNILIILQLRIYPQPHTERVQHTSVSVQYWHKTSGADSSPPAALRFCTNFTFAPAHNFSRPDQQHSTVDIITNEALH